MSRSFDGLGSFAAFLTETVAHVEHARHEALEAAAILVEDEAKRVIGTYDYGWPQLAPATQADRVAQGFSDNEPGLRTGEMRDGIEHQTSHNETQVGSNDDKLVFFELGTSKQPPRSVLMGAAVHKEHEVRELLGHRTVAALIKP